MFDINENVLPELILYKVGGIISLNKITHAYKLTTNRFSIRFTKK